MRLRLVPVAVLAAMVATLAHPEEACRPTGVPLDFGRYPIGARVSELPVLPAFYGRCHRNDECSMTGTDGVQYSAAPHEAGRAAVIERKELSGTALNAYGAQLYGWRFGDTVAVAQHKFQRATGKMLVSDVNSEGEFLLYDACARNRFGEYQFYAVFGKAGRLETLITRIDSPND
ncbi:hypothetical protein ASD21_13595 [Caulobacter sp. Root1455]|jgi:hypothetical protein|uniref:hypothetical protein n=1 Tax=unclassified Caulobacter TaxID=2648921 RepID=UPI0006F7FC91|nr:MULTISPECIES: hypothetical protein [unclassified Caulobacter]KQY30134.1 hypothetical protein ASD38_12655 [Caulobacter sp. Root487D2Y]KQY92434.1 hypothetical protein ASD21_13595 [Caulobacter sp. Root1455]